MASHSLVIAKASLSAGLMRPDPTPVPRDQITQFHELLDITLVQCSPTNIQRCKLWLIRNTISSTARVTAVGKYLVALSTALPKTGEQEKSITSQDKGTSIPRKQLHILYLVNDLLHHIKYHNDSTSQLSDATSILQPFIVALFKNASAYDSSSYPKQHRKIDNLISEWEKQSCYEVAYLGQLREEVANAGTQESKNGPSIQEPGNESGKTKQDVPYVMPASHGETAAPYYDLPAGNLMPHILPNSASPIDPRSVKPLQFVAGLADERLVIAIKDFMKDVDVLYGQGPEVADGISVDIDELGQPLFRAEMMGETVEGDTYYGWSKAFCKKMKQRRSGKIASRSRNRSDSLDRSRSPRKRRRYSSSQESRSPSRTRSDMKFQHRGPARNQRDRSYSRSKSRSRTRSRSPLPRYQRTSSSRSRSRSRTRSYSPPVELPLNQHQTSSRRSQAQAMPQVYSPVPPLPVSVPFSGQFPPGIPLGPSGLPIPPPPPPNYSGPWPPPPPPLGSNPGMFQLPGFVPPPPPPPVDSYRNRSPHIPSGYPSYGNPVGQGGVLEHREQYGGVPGYGGPGTGAGYGGYPPQGHRGGQYGGRGRGGRGGWRG